MKSIYKFSTLFIIAVAVFCPSCEEALEVDIRSSIVAGDFPANGEEAQALMFGIYRDMKEDMNSTTYHIDRSETFDVGVIGTVSNAWTQFITATNGPSWTGFYNALHNINFLLSVVDDLSFSNEDDRKLLKAEALFARAFYYFYMARIWGDVPLVLEPTQSPDKEVIARTPEAQVYAQINQDITESINLFPSDGFGNRNFASKPAAYALQADIKMWTGKVLGGGTADFDAALAAIQNIENAGAVLLDNFADVFDTKRNNEVIFALFNHRDESVNHYASRTSPRDINVDPELSPDVPFSKDFGARHNYAPSQRTMDLFTDPNDLRIARTFVPMFLTAGEPPISYSQNKFRGEIIDEDRAYTDDLMMYRWADLLLLRAEAYAAKNDIPNAVIALNEVRNRAGIGNYTGPMDQASINREILDERGRELFLEPKRWWDLRRFHADGTIDVYQFVPNLVGQTTPLYWSVSENVMALNPLIKQTDGY